jgi:glutamine---fructose-6-phosphate transaminase (isomerizing)
MCGIIGIVGQSDVSHMLMEGLKRLEYRGYDSAGITTLSNGALTSRKVQGKLVELENEVSKFPIIGTVGIGHTRWATHGKPSVRNAHPHVTDEVAVVHNGIIENFQELREELQGKGIVFMSETDTEVIPQLVSYYLRQGLTPQDAAAVTLKRLIGAFAVGILFAGEEHFLIAARRGSPLAIGYGEGEMYLGSDAFALAALTSRITYLEDGDWAELNREGVVIYDEDGNKVEREIKLSALSKETTGKGDYPHFMLKEIHEQPVVLANTLRAYYDRVTHEFRFPKLPFTLDSVSHVTIVACGTSYYAGLVAKYWLEKYARITVSIDIASEFRYRQTVLPENGVALFISQSGETADTLAALRYAKNARQHIISLVNVEESSMALASDAIFVTHAGPEIGVASTKAFTTQLTVLACLTLAIAGARNTIEAEESRQLCEALSELPIRLAGILSFDTVIREVALKIAEAKSALFVGRGTSYAVAMEGALKMKELTYIHAEGIAAGELKHGPIALVDEHLPIIALAPTDSLFDKTYSNIQEIAARGGTIIAFTDAMGLQKMHSILSTSIVLPTLHPFVTPLLYALPMQLLAYHVAAAKGTDIDQPRNLAKSVTVE